MIHSEGPYARTDGESHCLDHGSRSGRAGGDATARNGAGQGSAHCTIAKAFVCKADGACAPATEIGEVKLPNKVTLDFQNRVMMSLAKDGFPVSSSISTLIGADKQLIAQGVDDGVGWIFHGSGRDMTATFAMASNHTVLSAFGTCELDLGE
jgi:hypothetical protein